MFYLSYENKHFTFQKKNHLKFTSKSNCNLSVTFQFKDATTNLYALLLISSLRTQVD